MGSDEERKNFVTQVRKGCRIAEFFRKIGVRPHGVVRIDSASSPDEWYKDPEANQKISFDAERAAANLYKQAEQYEGLYKSGQVK